MRAKDLGQSRLLNLIFKPAGLLMGSRLRGWLMDPRRTLSGAGLGPGQDVLEVGCGTGFFTLPAAAMIGPQGTLTAMDISEGFIAATRRKVARAGLTNVTVVRRDALETGLHGASVDKVLLLGVIPFPLLPLPRLLPEMYRVLRLGGGLAVWLFPPLVHAWVPRAIASSGLFAFMGRREGVYNYQRAPAGPAPGTA